MLHVHLRTRANTASWRSRRSDTSVASEQSPSELRRFSLVGKLEHIRVSFWRDVSEWFRYQPKKHRKRHWTVLSQWRALITSRRHPSGLRSLSCCGSLVRTRRQLPGIGRFAVVPPSTCVCFSSSAVSKNAGNSFDSVPERSCGHYWSVADLQWNNAPLPIDWRHDEERTQHQQTTVASDEGLAHCRASSCRGKWKQLWGELTSGGSVVTDGSDVTGERTSRTEVTSQANLQRWKSDNQLVALTGRHRAILKRELTFHMLLWMSVFRRPTIRTSTSQIWPSRRCMTLSRSWWEVEASCPTSGSTRRSSGRLNWSRRRSVASRRNKSRLVACICSTSKAQLYKGPFTHAIFHAISMRFWCDFAYKTCPSLPRTGF